MFQTRINSFAASFFIFFAAYGFAATPEEINRILRLAKLGDQSTIEIAQAVGIKLDHALEFKNIPVTVLEYALTGPNGYDQLLPDNNLLLAVKLVTEQRVPWTSRAIKILNKHIRVTNGQFIERILQTGSFQFLLDVLTHVDLLARQRVFDIILEMRSEMESLYSTAEERRILMGLAHVGLFSWKVKDTDFQSFIENRSSFPNRSNGSMNCNQLLQSIAYLASHLERDQINDLVKPLPSDGILYDAVQGKISLTKVSASPKLTQQMRLATNGCLMRNLGRNTNSLVKVNSEKQVADFLDKNAVNSANIYFDSQDGGYIGHVGFVYRATSAANIMMLHLDDTSPSGVDNVGLNQYFQNNRDFLKSGKGWRNIDVSLFALGKIRQKKPN